MSESTVNNACKDGERVAACKCQIVPFRICMRFAVCQSPLLLDLRAELGRDVQTKIMRISSSALFAGTTVSCEGMVELMFLTSPKI